MSQDRQNRYPYDEESADFENVNGWGICRDYDIFLAPKIRRKKSYVEKFLQDPRLADLVPEELQREVQRHRGRRPKRMSPVPRCSSSSSSDEGEIAEEYLLLKRNASPKRARIPRRMQLKIARERSAEMESAQRAGQVSKKNGKSESKASVVTKKCGLRDVRGAAAKEPATPHHFAGRILFKPHLPLQFSSEEESEQVAPAYFCGDVNNNNDCTARVGDKLHRGLLNRMNSRRPAEASASEESILGKKTRAMIPVSPLRSIEEVSKAKEQTPLRYIKEKFTLLVGKISRKLWAPSEAPKTEKMQISERRYMFLASSIKEALDAGEIKPEPRELPSADDKDGDKAWSMNPPARKVPSKESVKSNKK